jgi:hypothetical protein
MMMTPKSGLFLAGTCLAAIAGVGSLFELAYGDPDLGVVPTSIVLTLSLPVAVILFIAAVKDTKANQQ